MNTIQNYEQADALLQGRCRLSRRLANNTYLIRNVDNSLLIRLHQTDVVTYHPDSTITLNSGGWRTSTTKDRINTFSPARVCQHKGVWYIGDSFFYHSSDKGDRILFHDNIITAANGLPIGSYDIETKDHKKQRRHLLKQIKAYAKLCADSCPLDSPIWAFSDKTVTNETQLQNMREGYVINAIVFAACDRFHVSKVAMRALFTGDDHPYMNDIGKQQIQKAVYRFVKQQFGLAS